MGGTLSASVCFFPLFFKALQLLRLLWNEQSLLHDATVGWWLNFTMYVWPQGHFTSSCISTLHLNAAKVWKLSTLRRDLKEDLCKSCWLYLKGDAVRLHSLSNKVLVDKEEQPLLRYKLSQFLCFFFFTAACLCHAILRPIKAQKEMQRKSFFFPVNSFLNPKLCNRSWLGHFS